MRHYSFPGKAAPSGAWSADEDRLAQLMEVFGPFPKSLLERGTRTERFFDKNGGLLRIPRLHPASLESLIDGAHDGLRRPEDMPKNEVPIFADFLRGMLTLDPANRKSAAEMLEHEWLNS
ncbi:hypothetical protein MMC16_007403 [Acarospora aff. strigata]|nr:hypothetical protein [Acarospora aff. strigata]